MVKRIPLYILAAFGGWIITTLIAHDLAKLLQAKTLVAMDHLLEWLNDDEEMARADWLRHLQENGRQ